MSNRTIGVLGLGIFGSTIVKTLSKFNCDIIAIDAHEENINLLDNFITKGVVGNITKFEELEAVGIGDCDVVIIATGSSLESSVLAVMHCNKLGVPQIIAKAKTRTSAEILTKIGATRIVSPEKETGARIARNIIHSRITDVITLDNNISLLEFYPPKDWIGKSLSEIDLRKKYDMNLIGYRTKEDSRLNIQFNAEYTFNSDQLLVAITESDTFENENYLEDFS